MASRGAEWRRAFVVQSHVRPQSVDDAEPCELLPEALLEACPARRCTAELAMRASCSARAAPYPAVSSEREAFAVAGPTPPMLRPPLGEGPATPSKPGEGEESPELDPPERCGEGDGVDNLEDEDEDDEEEEEEEEAEPTGSAAPVGGKAGAGRSGKPEGASAEDWLKERDRSPPPPPSASPPPLSARRKEGSSSESSDEDGEGARAAPRAPPPPPPPPRPPRPPSRL